MKLVPVSELFEVNYGTSLELNALETCEEGVPFVSRSSQNNGVTARVVLAADIAPIPAGALSVALGGSPLSTFLQEEPFYTGRDVAYLVPKTALSRDVLLYYATCLQANRFRFSYGRQANRSLASLLLPALSEVPSWVKGGLNEKPESLWSDLKASRTTLRRAAREPLDTSAWVSFSLASLFDVRKGARLTKDEMSEGATLYVGATESDNGITARIGQAALHPGGQLTVSYNGSVAEAFYQPEPFWASDDVNVLYPKFDMSPELALFFCTLIRLEKYRYNYGRKWRLEVMRASTVRLPVDDAGSPDWQAMAAIVRRCPAFELLSRNMEP